MGRVRFRSGFRPTRGPQVLMATSDGLTSMDMVRLLEESEFHLNWGFTQPGTYELTFRAYGLLDDGDTIVDVSRAYHLHVRGRSRQCGTDHLGSR